ncbi:MAG: VOC family protein [Pirellulaceae bacterium]
MTFAHLTLATRDVPGTSAFFQKSLGWDPISRPDNINQTAAWLNMAPSQQLHLLYVDDFEVSKFEAEFGRHFAIFEDGDDFAGLKERLVENGAELIEPLRDTPFERFFFRDPNGYIFEVIDRNGYVTE